MVSRLLLGVCFLFLLPILGFGQNSEGYALHEILRQHSEVYGGLRDADALMSLSVEGRIRIRGQSYEFLMRKKRPDSMRYRLSLGRNEVIVSFDGESGWMRSEANGEVTVTDLDAAATRALRAQARFDSPLFRHTEKPENEITLLGPRIVEEQKVNVVEVRQPDGRVSRYYLDAVTALVLRHDDLDGEGEVAFQTRYEDFREVDGFPIAHRVDYRVGPEAVASVEINTVEVNPGILSFYFEKPSR